MFEQHLSGSGIFGQNDICGAKRFYGPQRNVVQIADRSRYDKQFGHNADG